MFVRLIDRVFACLFVDLFVRVIFFVWLCVCMSVVYVLCCFDCFVCLCFLLACLFVCLFVRLLG